MPSPALVTPRSAHLSFCPALELPEDRDMSYSPTSPSPSAAPAQGTCSTKSCRDGADAPGSAVCPQLWSHKRLRNLEEGALGFAADHAGCSCPSALPGSYLQTVRSCSLCFRAWPRDPNSLSHPEIQTVCAAGVTRHVGTADGVRGPVP